MEILVPKVPKQQCSNTHTCVHNACVPACSPIPATCAKGAECYGINHEVVHKYPSGYAGNPRISCNPLGCRSSSNCSTNKACINSRCGNPCDANPCSGRLECTIYNHVVECSCDVESSCTPSM